MKVLFVCRGNIGRSQIAKEFCNAFSHGRIEADSCGTMVGENNGKLITDSFDKAVNDIRSMKELGIDMSLNRRKQLNSKLLKDVDQIIVMAEKETWPQYLLNNAKVVYWEIANPIDCTYNKVCEIRDLIKEKVIGYLADTLSI